MTPPLRIVIVGGGVAGVLLATRLGARSEKGRKWDITLIDRSPSHIWKPMLHTFAAGTTNSYQERISFVAQAARFAFRYFPGSMESVDRHRKVVHIGPITEFDGEVVLEARQVAYDTLILATGCRANDFATPGAAKHCMFIDDLPQAEAFNHRLYAQLLRAASAGDPLPVAVVGGGATGVELVAEISQLIDYAAAYGTADIRAKLKLTLIESSPRILAAFPETVSNAAARQLERLGVTIRVGARVVAVDECGFHLADGERITATLRVWAAGVKATDPIAALADFEHSSTGQLRVDSTLRTTTDIAVFAIGDCSSLTLPGTSRPLAPTAQVARQQALHLIRHLPPWLNKQVAIPPFSFRDLGSLVALGRYDAFGTLGRNGIFEGAFLQGRFAQLSHAMLYRLHQAEVNGFRRAATLWLADALSSMVRPKIRLD